MLIERVVSQRPADLEMHKRIELLTQREREVLLWGSPSPGLWIPLAVVAVLASGRVLVHRYERRIGLRASGVTNQA
jgi:hypothetical protein